MKNASDIRVGNVVRIDGKACKVITQEIRGSGKSGKTVHLKLKSLSDGNVSEKGIRAEDKIEELELRHVKMQYLYRDDNQFVFMNMETYEQISISAQAVGQQAVFLKENMEIDVELIEEKPVNVVFPKSAELTVVSAPPAVKGGDNTYKEVELENGLKILVPQFVKEGERVKIDVENLAYLERVTTKSLKTEQLKPEI